MLIKRLFALLIWLVCTFCLLAGCTININVGHPAEDASKEADSKTIFDYIINRENQTTLYESCATIYISNTPATDTIISSSDLEISKQLMETYSVILQSNAIQGQIREEYPEVEYTLSLEPINETEVCTIIATGENPEHLEDICNMAVSLLCEEIPQTIEGASCKVIDVAKSAQEVDINP